jgi:hypothetical protein
MQAVLLHFGKMRSKLFFLLGSIPAAHIGLPDNCLPEHLSTLN